MIGRLPFLVLLSLAGCNPSPPHKLVVAAEEAEKTARACYEDSEQIKFEYSENCRRYAEMSYPGKLQVGLEELNEEESDRHAIAVLSSDAIYWKAYAVSAYRELHPKGPASLANRIRDPEWMRAQRAFCLKNLPSEQCSSVADKSILRETLP